MFAQPAVATLSSQAPFSTFQENSLSSQTPAELRNFLIDLINNIDIDRLRCSTPDARLNQWKKILRELCQFILTPFTPPADLAWENLHEKIVLIENGLIVINKFCDIRQDYVILFDTHKMAQKIIITLLAIVTSLESRLFVPVPEDARYLTPETLHTQARQTMTRVIRCMGAVTKARHANLKGTSWDSLGTILGEFLSVCDGMYSWCQEVLLTYVV